MISSLDIRAMGASLALGSWVEVMGPLTLALDLDRDNFDVMVNVKHYFTQLIEEKPNSVAPKIFEK